MCWKVVIVESCIDLIKVCRKQVIYCSYGQSKELGQEDFRMEYCECLIGCICNLKVNALGENYFFQRYNGYDKRWGTQLRWYQKKQGEKILEILL